MTRRTITELVKFVKYQFYYTYGVTTYHVFLKLHSAPLPSYVHGSCIHIFFATFKKKAIAIKSNNK